MAQSRARFTVKQDYKMSPRCLKSLLIGGSSDGSLIIAASKTERELKVKDRVVFSGGGCLSNLR